MSKKVVSRKTSVRAPRPLFSADDARLFLIRVSREVRECVAMTNPATQFVQRAKTGGVKLTAAGREVTISLNGFTPAYKVSREDPIIATTPAGNLRGHNDKGDASAVLEAMSRGESGADDIVALTLAIVAYAAAGVSSGRGEKSGERRMMSLIVGAAEDVLGLVVADENVRMMSTYLRGQYLNDVANGGYALEQTKRESRRTRRHAWQRIS